MEIDQIARTAKLMSLPLAFGGRAVAGLGRRLAGADRAEVSATTTARNAEQLFAVLGRLKGGAMKIGQALSVFDTMVPEEIAEPYADLRTLARFASLFALVVPGVDARALVAELRERTLDELDYRARHVADGEPEPMMRLLRAEGFVAGDVAPEEVRWATSAASATRCASNGSTSTGRGCAARARGSSGTSGAGAPGARSRCRPSTSWSYGCCPAG